METFEKLEELVNLGQSDAAKAFFEDAYTLTRSGPFRFEVTPKEATTPQGNTPTEIWQREGTPGMRGALYRAVSALDNARRNKRYLDLAQSKQSPPVITQGDSWFAFPFIEPLDVSESLASLTPVYSLACPGDDMTDISRGEKLDELIWAVDHTGSDHVALSAGGNELIGDHFPDVLRTTRHAQSAMDFLHLDRVNRKIEHVADGLERILQRLIAIKPDIRVYCHSYDYPLPDINNGRFLGPALDRAGIPPEKHKAICQLLLDMFDNTLVSLCQRYAANLNRVDFRGVSGGRPDHWADEVHLTSDSSAKAAQRLYHAITTRSQT